MRIKVVGNDTYPMVNTEYDIMLSTTVMNIKVRILVFSNSQSIFILIPQNDYSIQPNEQQLTYKGFELKNERMSVY